MATLHEEIQSQIEKRRTFAIISHPDAGKTTLTEKLLLFGGAIRMAGEVKGRKVKKFATSDWMQIEKERGISVPPVPCSSTTMASGLTSWILLGIRTSVKIPTEP